MIFFKFIFPRKIQQSRLLIHPQFFRFHCLKLPCAFKGVVACSSIKARTHWNSLFTGNEILIDLIGLIPCTQQAKPLHVMCAYNIGIRFFKSGHFFLASSVLGFRGEPCYTAAKFFLSVRVCITVQKRSFFLHDSAKQIKRAKILFGLFCSG